jgi:enterochelin esterase-like enzyme
MNKYKIILIAIILSIGLLSFYESYQCETESQIINGTINSKILGKNVAYSIYLPFKESDASVRYPVLYLLHGHGGDETNWFQKDQGNMAFLMDSLRCIKKIPSMVAVSFDAGNSWYVDRKEKMESFYFQEFIPFIESIYPVDSFRGRYIGGNSAGGYGSLRFALQKPDWFKSAILLSPASYEPLPPAISSARKIEAFALNGVFNDSIWHHYSYTRLWDPFLTSTKKPKFYLSVGDDDVYNIVPVVTTLQQRMLQQQIPYELRITDGGHDWACWRANISEALVSIFSERK